MGGQQRTYWRVKGALFHSGKELGGLKVEGEKDSQNRKELADFFPPKFQKTLNVERRLKRRLRDTTEEVGRFFHKFDSLYQSYLS